MTERTLSIIKPDAVSKSVIGEIYSRFEKAGLKIIAAKMVQLDEDSAGGFYAEHQGKGFYSDLINLWDSLLPLNNIFNIYIPLIKLLKLIALFILVILRKTSLEFKSYNSKLISLE